MQASTTAWGRLEQRRKRALGMVVFASAAIHLIALGLAFVQARGGGWSAGQPRMGVRPQLRLLPAADAAFTAVDTPRDAVVTASTATPSIRTAPATAPTSPASAPPARQPASGGLPAYLAASALDEAPQALVAIEPEYPASAGRQQGLVQLRVFINDKGLVDDVRVDKAFPAGVFDAAAIAAFAAARFTPGRVGSKAMAAEMQVEMEFVPTNRAGSVSGQSEE